MAVVSVENLTKAYSQGESSVEVLKGLTFTIDDGEFVAIQGTSGSGKSTLLYILGLMDRPTTGTYQLAGRDVSTLPDDQLSDERNRRIGVVFQSFYLIPYASALENVMLPGMYSGRPSDEVEASARDLLARVGLADRVDFVPAQLSGGQQQRVALARSLVNDPALVLADEPTGQLDSATSTEIMELISTFNQAGKTIILVTHEEETAAYARRRIHITDGRIDTP